MALHDAIDATTIRWVTADQHFYHGAALRWAPWRQELASSVSDMNRVLVAAWNKVVDPHDTVLCLGDFALGKRDDVAKLIGSLQGRLVLVRGNHDRISSGFLRSRGVEVHRRLLRLRAGHTDILCRHRPDSFSKDDVASAAVLLHGHCHGKATYTSCVEGVREKAIDVGIDAHLSPYPLLLERFYAS